MALTALGRFRSFMSRSQVHRAILYVDRTGAKHLIHTLILPSSNNARRKIGKPLSMALNQPLKKQPSRTITDWNQKRSESKRTRLEILVINLSLGVFLLYFLWLREPNDIDEQMNRPIWERLPGISPEQAEQMMELDRRLGLQVDKAGLEQYKKEYYANQLAKMEEEARAEERHRKLRNASQDHFNMLQQYEQKDRD